MSFIQFFPTNLVTKDETIITVNNEDPFYPASNLRHPFTTKTYRTQEGTTTMQIVFDFKTAEEIDSCLIVDNSLDGFGFLSPVTIEANATSNFTSPAFTTTLSPSAKFGFGHVGFATQEYRFWRVTLTSTEYVELSNIYLGTKVQLTTNNIDFGWSYQNFDRSKFISNRYGQRFVDVINSQKRIRANFNLLNISEAEQIMDMFNEIGKTTPIWCVVDDSETIISDKERFAGYFYMDQRPTFTNSSFGLYDVSFQFRQAL